MKKYILLLTIFLFSVCPVFSAQQIVESGGGIFWSSEKDKINSNFTELYGKIVSSTSLSGTTLTITFADATTVNVDLAGLQDGTGTDSQTITALSLNETTNVLTVTISGGNTATVDLSGLDVGAGSTIDDTAGNGDTAVTWSADKSFDENALKQGIDAELTDIATIDFVQGDVLTYDGTNVVKLSPGTAGQYLKTGGADGDISWGDPAGSGDITAVGDSVSGAAFTPDGTGNVLYLEGTTANNFEIALTGANPVADVVLTLPAATDTLVGKATSDVLTNKNLTSGTNTFPIFNQDTTGNAATATLATTATNATNATNATTAATANTGDSATLFFPSGTIESARLPDLSITYEPADAAIVKSDEAETLTANWINTANPWAVNEGGTGVATLNDAGLLVGNGTSGIEALADGLTTQFLVGGGANINPTWSTDLPGGTTLGSQYIYRIGGTDVSDADVTNSLTINAQDGSTWNVVDSVTTTSVYNGTTSLEESTSATDSGAYIVGVYDDFTNATATNVQGVLKQLDTAISGSGSTLGDVLTTTPLLINGGANLNDILPGVDADVTISMPAATASANGYLTATDWNTFNNKQAALTSPIVAAGAQSITGVKTYTVSPIVPTPTTDYQAATKEYVDDNAGGADNLGTATATDVTALFTGTGYLKSDGSAEEGIEGSAVGESLLTAETYAAIRALLDLEPGSDIPALSCFANTAAFEACFDAIVLGGGGGTISITQQSADPSYDDLDTGDMVVATGSGDLFYKSATGFYTFAGAYAADPATYYLSIDVVDFNGTDYFTRSSINYTTDQTFTGLITDQTFTVTPDTGRTISCTGAGITDNGGGSYTSNSDSANIAATCTASAAGGSCAVVAALSNDVAWGDFWTDGGNLAPESYNWQIIPNATARTICQIDADVYNAASDGNVWVEIWSSDRTTQYGSNSDPVAITTETLSGMLEFTWDGGTKPSVPATDYTVVVNTSGTGGAYLGASTSTTTLTDVMWAGGIERASSYLRVRTYVE